MFKHGVMTTSFGLAMALSQLAMAQPPTRIRDINSDLVGSSPQDIVAIGSTVFYQATDAAAGAELWRSDGTTAGTARLEDINPGPAGSTPSDLIVVGSTLYFTADDGTHGRELWKSDGTASGTVMVMDINPGSAPSSPFEITNVAGALLFMADDGSRGDELWTSDGSAAGTALVKDIWPGPQSGASHFSDEWHSWTAVGGTLYFNASDATAFGLWRSDGTAAGTGPVAGTSPCGINFWDSGLLSAVGARLYLRADDGTIGAEPYFLDAGEPARVLLRSNAVSQLEPVQPALGQVLPLDGARDVYRWSVASGFVDDEPGLLGDAGQPLVFYALREVDTLRLAKAGGATEVSF